MALNLNQGLDSVVSTSKVRLGKLVGPPEMQQVAADMAGTRLTLHLSYANPRISVPAEVGTGYSRWYACARA